MEKTLGVHEMRISFQEESPSSLASVLPRESAKHARFAINFFTSIGMGYVTDELRNHLEKISRETTNAKMAEEETVREKSTGETIS